MITTTHVALGAAAARWGRLGDGRATRVALVVGSGLPDVPLLGALLVAALGALLGGESPTAAVADVLAHGFEAAHPLVLAHVGLHAPLTALVALGAGAALGRGWLRGLAAGLLLHTALDVLTHAEDGPLLLWPWTWEVQLHSPLAWSITDPLGPWLLALDVLAGLALGAWLLLDARRRPRA